MGMPLRKSIDQVELDLPELPQPETQEEEKGSLLDGSRDYLEQLEVYKRWCNEPWFLGGRGQTKSAA